MWQVTMNKYGSTWYYFTRNEVGGGFGSNNCGPKYIALARATSDIPAGTSYELIVNGKSQGIKVK